MLVEFEGVNECCGFGGIFVVKNFDVSVVMLIDKVWYIMDMGVEVCIVGDNFCLLYIGGGLYCFCSGICIVYLVEILVSMEGVVFV